MSGHHDDAVRRGYRFPAGVPAAFVDSGQTTECAAVNISRSGTLLVGTFPTPTSQVVGVSLKTLSGHLSIDLTGRIIRVTADPGNQETQLAIEFVDMDDARRDALEIFLARLLEAPQAGPLESLRPNATPQEVRKALDAIPLPQRISLAQRAELRQRELLRQDTHPAVLESLVRNPNLTLPEARAVAVFPALSVGAIDQLAADPRFRSDEELRMTLAAHPKVLLATAERLTADFKPPQIKKLLSRPGVGAALREKLFRRLTRG
jgi:hypothetical protein